MSRQLSLEAESYKFYGRISKKLFLCPKEIENNNNSFLSPAIKYFGSSSTMGYFTVTAQNFHGQ